MRSTALHQNEPTLRLYQLSCSVKNLIPETDFLLPQKISLWLTILKTFYETLVCVKTLC